LASQIHIKRILQPKGAALLAVLSVVAILFFYSNSESDQQTFTYLNHADDVAYVGMETCASCHGDKHATFVHTGMGLSFDSATRQKSSAHFGAEHAVYDTANDLHYLPYWKNDKLYIKEYRLAQGDTTHTLDVHINYIVGSGQHTNSHLFTHNGYVFQAPITFYVQEQKWDLAPGFEGGNNTRFNRILNSECISCHNAMPKMHGESDFKFTDIGRGIDCERCHGPGELHAKERLRGEGVDVTNEIDPTIVNPRKLSWERQIDLCQRCHLQGLNVLKEGKKFTDYKPGMKLSTVFEIYLPEYEGEHASFDMANHSQRFQMSKCFISGNKENLDFTCISCHNPHVSVKMTGTEVYNAACKNCHQKKGCTEAPGVLAAVDNNCVSCHMPPSGSEDIPHVSVHDHYIRVPKAKKDVDQMHKLIGLYAVNNPSPDRETEILAYLEYWEKFDKNPFYLQKAGKLLETNNFPKLWLKYHYLMRDYSSATALGLEANALSPWQNFMLGTSYLEQESISLGIFHLEKAYEEDQTNRVIASELLKWYTNKPDINKAVALGEALVWEFPTSGLIHNSLAKSYILRGSLAQALPNMQKALRLEPDNLAVWSTFLNYYAMQNDKENFTEWLRRINEQDASYLNPQQIARIMDSMPENATQ
jgi:hypothetical protein